MATPPDPTSDLQWGLWTGAIHEHLHRNAKKHPLKPCVIETHPRREFTYQQIDEASNALAHYLVASGIERGDRVMIYAFRNVDLVVAIMGTLKSGGTFSVIDPAYPPDRQIIYLDVARPRGLVVIGKAKGGGLSDTVNEWIKQNLHLKAFVPNLGITDDGIAAGGPSDTGVDVLDAAQENRTDLPGVVIGPDSNPTLSFTSGSEGRPKGVLGRHFSLVHYQSWMAEKFGMGPDDRFTMLSGIAHDPIQRDIFTPLFLGAQLIVPAPEDIQHERLAEWMCEHKTTVTHLTPAMGQILVGGATTQMPDLKNAFFVGDVLIKRDVRRLQDLAPNVHAINMFGTTETQRAVSYFLIPSRNEDPEFLNTLGDRIPAGKGMNNVQLLVVDRDNKQKVCGPGEQGEIYVRAAGLAEGYLGLDEVTREKFIPSWFVDPKHWVESEKATANGAQEEWRQFYKGPRDRLYRSGDLGHYNANGDVECTGRIDNQVKIRGFRFELGEIDTHLSHHPLVRENVTLIRRDEREEHILVSYVVPEMSKWADWLAEHKLKDEQHDTSMLGLLKRFRAFREELRDYLKTKVPNYAVPSVILPLDRMPLNPNGKIDKPALPFPTPDELAASLPQRPTFSAANRSPTENSLSDIWARLLDMPSASIAPEDSFLDLGGHSVLASRMLVDLRKQYGSIDINIHTIAEYPTLREFAAEIDRALDPKGRLLDFEGAQGSVSSRHGPHYAEDAKTLVAESLPKSFPTKTDKSVHTVLLTGATGFLGAFILANLLARPGVTVIAHVRAKTADEAAQRVRLTLTAYGLYKAGWGSRLQCIAGDLDAPRLGLAESAWTMLVDQVDTVIANGARVHWIDPYKALRGPNVVSLLTLFTLCAASTTTPKHLTFISSTAAVDTDHYAALAATLTAAGGAGVPESDDLAGASTGLATGYGQSKWVGEYVTRAAGRRGLSATVVRPGYVLGDAARGTSVADDFLVRMLKGCVQVGARPAIANGVNMVPVDAVAAIAVAACTRPPPPLASDGTAPTCSVSAHPRLSFTEFLAPLEAFGYTAPEVSYAAWSERVAQAVARSTGEPHALLPLAHMVLGDLPGSTRAPALDDANARAALRADTGRDWAAEGRLAVTHALVGKYLAYLVRVGFMPAPARAGLLPECVLGPEEMEALKTISGRGAI